MAGQLTASLGGGGSIEVQEPGPTDEGEEPPPGSEAFKAEADAERFDTTFLARADNWRIAEPTPAPTGFPLQAIPRLAFVINYNVVFDEDAGEWVPQNPFDGGGGVLTRVDSGIETVPGVDRARPVTSLTDPTLDLTATARFVNASEVTESFQIGEDNWGSPPEPAILASPLWNDSTGVWEALIFNPMSNAADLEWQVFEVSQQ